MKNWVLVMKILLYPKFLNFWSLRFVLYSFVAIQMSFSSYLRTVLFGLHDLIFLGCYEVLVLIL